MGLAEIRRFPPLDYEKVDFVRLDYEKTDFGVFRSARDVHRDPPVGGPPRLAHFGERF